MVISGNVVDIRTRRLRILGDWYGKRAYVTGKYVLRCPRTPFPLTILDTVGVSETEGR
jgi:hypothetical protein